MGKAPLIVQRDVPGFIWNRLQLAVLRECLHLLDEGVADVASIDAAVSDGLAPRWVGSGPFATADLGGIKTWATVATQLFAVLSNERGLPAALEHRAVEDGSFYSWTSVSEREVGELRARSLRENLRLIEARRHAMPPATDPST
jgi:3-hydroxybutyryl-CoA dehydrogenase